MKFMHISDLHLGKRVHDFSLIEDQKYILKQIVEKLGNENIKTLLIAGDIYDKSVPSVEAIKLFEWFINTLQELDINTLVISGNHDSNARLGYMNEITRKHNIYFSKEFNGEIEKIKINGVNFFLFPFLKPQIVRPFFDDVTDYDSMMKYLVSKCNINKSEKNVALVHQYLIGSITSDSEELSVGGIDQVDYSHFDDFDYVALGHIHRPQKIMRDVVRYSGSILKYSFSEARYNKSCVIVDTNDFSFELSELVPLYDMVEIKGYYNEIISKEYRSSLNNRDDYFHITLLDEENIFEALHKLRTVYPKIMKLDYDINRPAQNKEIEAKKLMSPFDFFNELYLSQNNVELSEEQAEITRNIMDEIWGQNETY